MQIMKPPRQQEYLSGLFTDLTAEGLQQFHPDGTLQVLDDCGKSLTFQRANIYSAERITTGKERILRHIVLPYKLKRSSRSYSWYQRITERE
jgi:CMP-2-keto-3-deoxyoctulosonic acid synthetase